MTQRFDGIVYGDAFNDVQILTTAADTTTTLNGTYRSSLLITGTAVMQVYDLGVATAYANGKVFTFYNATPEFVGVVNSDLTVFHRVPPRSRCTCVLVSNASAAGTWFSFVDDPAVGDPAVGLSAFIDFNHTTSGNSVFSDPGMVGVVSGAGALCAPIAIGVGGRQGVFAINTGTTIAGYAIIYNHITSPNYLGSGCRAFETSQAISAISSAADEYIARYGIGDNITGGAHTEGAYFLYDRLTLGTNWQFKTIKTAGGAGNTVTDTGVIPTMGTTGAEWQKLRLEIASGGARADAWIDNVQVTAAGGQANLPAATTAIKIAHMGITKTEDAGVNARYLKVDYLRLQSYPTTLR